MEVFSGRRLMDPFCQAQEKGLKFWQTRSHATLVHDAVRADCVEKWHPREETQLGIGDSPRLGLLRE